jgi:flagellar M-ring protein FliF
VSSAVEGLAPEAVSVLDMQGNLLSRPRRAGLEGEAPSEAKLDYKHQVERDLMNKIASTLEPLLGAEKFRAGVTVDCDFTSGEQSEEVFDPTRSVMASSQKTEDVSGASGAAGIPGTASALPRPAPRPAAAGTAVSRHTENVTYQTSRTVRRTRLPQGGVKRISIAVLLDHALRWEGKRRILEPVPPERIKSIRELVAAVTGVDATRGDQVIVESLPFETSLAADPPPDAAAQKPAPAPAAQPNALPFPPRTLAIAGAGAALLLLLAILFAARRRRRNIGAAPAAQAALPAPGATAVEAAHSAETQLAARFAEQEALKRRQEAEALSQLQLPPVTTKKAEVLAKHLVDTAKKDPVAAAHVLRTWLYDTDR